MEFSAVDTSGGKWTGGAVQVGTRFLSWVFLVYLFEHGKYFIIHFILHLYKDVNIK